jgi:hypothetical protein
MERQSQGRLREIAWATAGCAAIALAAGAQAWEEPVPLPPVDGASADGAQVGEELTPLPPVVDTDLAPADVATSKLSPRALQTAISTALEVPWIRRPDGRGDRSDMGPIGYVAPASTVEVVPADQVTELDSYSTPILLLAQAAPIEPPLEEAPPADPSEPLPPEPPIDDQASGEPPPLPTPPPEQPWPPLVAPDEPIDGAAAPADSPGYGEPPCPCENGNGSGPGGCAACSPLAGCHENPGESFPSTVQNDILELFAVDIARRCLLALHPYAADEPILTLDVVVRPSGHIVHTYARLQWHRRHWWNLRGPAKVYETEVSASIVYHPDRRRVFDVSYVDNAYLPFRNIDMTSQVTASYNEDFALRDGTGLPPKFLSDRVDVLEPYPEARIFNYGPVREPDPRAKQLRVVRRDSNVTANQ